VALVVGYPDMPPSLTAAMTFQVAHAHHIEATIALCRMPVLRGTTTWPPTQGSRCPACVRLAAEELLVE
jgi:hypothetical protein